jgi:hypothetical protein
VNVEINEMRDRRASLRTAMAQVESSVSRPAPGRVSAWSAELQTQLEVLSAALEVHVHATEGPEGMLDDIVVARPDMADRVTVARQDHKLLRYEIHAVLTELPTDDAGVVDIRAQVVHLLSGLARHRQAGADMMFEAYRIDVESPE